MLKQALRQVFRRTLGIDVVRRGSAWSLIEQDQLERFFEEFEVDCIFDIGANVGQYAEKVFYTQFAGLIISFEPNPEAFDTLEKKSDGNSRWKVFQCALDQVSREVEFNVMVASQFSSLHAPDHSATDIFADRNKVIETVVLTTVTLDQIFEDLSVEFKFKRPFLKMDTQGHDLSVVAGAETHIRKFVGLQSELSFTPLYENCPTYAESLQLYERLGFKLTALIPNNAGHFPNLHEVDCLMYNPSLVTEAVRCAAIR
jgi:FkbM family methyltransferase